MTEGKNRQWILNARPAGKLTGEEFLWNEAPIPRPSEPSLLNSPLREGPNLCPPRVVSISGRSGRNKTTNRLLNRRRSPGWPCHSTRMITPEAAGSFATKRDRRSAQLGASKGASVEAIE